MKFMIRCLSCGKEFERRIRTQQEFTHCPGCHNEIDLRLTQELMQQERERTRVIPH